MPKRAADGGDLGDRENGQLRIGQRLGVIGAGAGVGGAAEILRIGRIDEAHLDALVLQRVGEQVPGAAVEIGRADDVVARAREVLDREGRGRLPRGQRQRGDAAFERRDALLQHVVGRIHDARVDVAELLQREQVRGVLGVAELIGGGLIDRHGDRAGGRVGAPAGVKGERFRTLCLRRRRHERDLPIEKRGGSKGFQSPPQPAATEYNLPLKSRKKGNKIKFFTESTTERRNILRPVKCGERRKARFNLTGSRSNCRRRQWCRRRHRPAKYLVTRVIAMDPTAAEFGAVRRVDVAAPLYAMGFDIIVPLPLQFGRCIKNQRAALPVLEHRRAGKSGTGQQETARQ